MTTSSAIVDWVLPLAGHNFDLEDLPEWLAGEEVRVEQWNGSYALVIPTSVAGDDYENVRPFAEDRLQLINGVASALNGSFRPVSLKNELYGVNKERTVRHTIVAVGTAEMRMKAGRVRVSGGAPQPVTEPAAAPLLRAARRAPEAHDALVLIGRPSLTWPELYLLFEFVEGDVGSAMYDRGWISRAAAELFTRTANSYTALRSGSRHGRDRGDLPAQPMTRDVAVSLIRRLVCAWLEHLGSVADGQ
jgi:hypothetical protein